MIEYWENMPSLNIPRSTHSYNIILSCFGNSGHVDQMMQFYNKMKEDGFKPDRYSFHHIIDGYKYIKVVFFYFFLCNLL
jgi:pentatricopeptide repeat protein